MSAESQELRYATPPKSRREVRRASRARLRLRAENYAINHYSANNFNFESLLTLTIFEEDDEVSNGGRE
jgi:hypothetical protein